MRYADIVLHLKENYEEDLKRVLRDALVSLKTQGVKKINTQQILNDFTSQGINISVTELLHLLQGDPLIQDANQEQVTFSQDVPDLEVNNQEFDKKTQAEINADTLDRMSRKALHKRI